MFGTSCYFPRFLFRRPEVAELECSKLRQQNFEDFGKNFIFFLQRDIYVLKISSNMS